MAQYNLIFQGEIVADVFLDDVKQKIAKLFNADAEKTAQLFSGNPIVIKKNLDEETCQKYLAVLKKTGAIVKAIPVQNSTAETALQNQLNKTDTPQENSSSVSQQTTPAAPQISSGGLSSSLSALVNYNQPVQTTVNHEAEEKTALPGHDVAAPVAGDTRVDDVPDITDAPTIDEWLQLSAEHPGDFHVEKHVAAVEIAETSHLSMAEAQTGSLQEFTPEATPVELPDISSLSMSEAQTGSLQGFAEEHSAVELPDISSLSISEAQQGSLEGIEKKTAPVDIPDISHLRFS